MKKQSDEKLAAPVAGKVSAAVITRTHAVGACVWPRSPISGTPVPTWACWIPITRDPGIAGARCRRIGDHWRRRRWGRGVIAICGTHAHSEKEVCSGKCAASGQQEKSKQFHFHFSSSSRWATSATTAHSGNLHALCQSGMSRNCLVLRQIKRGCDWPISTSNVHLWPAGRPLSA
jgi:hypothetical protein